MLKTVAFLGVAAAILTIPACGGKSEPAEAVVETPAPTLELRGSTETNKPVVQEASTDTRAFGLTDWKAKKAAVIESAAGLSVTLEEKGYIYAQTDHPVEPGEKYLATLEIEASSDQTIRARVLRGCGKTEVNQSFGKIAPQPGPNTLTVKHRFKFEHGCARLRVDSPGGPNTFTITKASLTKLDGSDAAR